MNVDTKNKPTYSSRLQRPPDFTGSSITTFAGVVKRHGAPGLCLGLLLALISLLNPTLWAQLNSAFQPALSAPIQYIFSALLILLVLTAFSALRNKGVNTTQLLWIVYLGLLSGWEEWVFRAALPKALTQTAFSPEVAIILSNVLFGAAHYFTLRWRWYWCVGACLGGLALSRHFGNHNDLLVIIGIHWVATFLNTPRPPGRSAVQPQ